jgi:hypothetical protein
MIATAIAGNAVLCATVVMLGGVMGASQTGVERMQCDR